MAQLSPVRVLAPAKINLFLAVTGPRSDGFHGLVSLVVPLDFGDRLELSLDEALERDCLDLVGVPIPGDAQENLVMKALKLFRERVPSAGHVRVCLEKNIPVGAGLGGGSSDAVAALKGMNALHGEPLPREALLDMAEHLGSDCPLFVDGKPVWMRGRGEVLTPVGVGLARALADMRFVLFKPAFGVNTAWAYSQLRSQPDVSYASEVWAEDQADDWEKAMSQGGINLYNSFEGPVSKKYPALPLLLDVLRKEGFASVMSGSGSACFSVPKSESARDKVYSLVRQAWGPDTFMIETRALDLY